MQTDKKNPFHDRQKCMNYFIDTYEHMSLQIVCNLVGNHNNKIQLSCNILCLILGMLYSSRHTHQYLKDDKIQCLL